MNQSLVSLEPTGLDGKGYVLGRKCRGAGTEASEGADEILPQIVNVLLCQRGLDRANFRIGTVEAL
jgi:hypothetical protein